MLMVCLLFLTAYLPVSAAEQTQYLFAVLPQQPPVVMHGLWRPLLDRLETELGVKLKLKLYENMGEYEASILHGDADFIFSTPAQIPMFYKKAGYIPLVRGTRYLTGIVFVRKDSPINTIADLKGQEVAFVGTRNV